MKAFLALCVLFVFAGCSKQAAASTGDSNAAPAAAGCCSEKAGETGGCDCCADKDKQATKSEKPDACCAEHPAEAPKKP
jgi:hypothetical protein